MFSEEEIFYLESGLAQISCFSRYLKGKDKLRFMSNLMSKIDRMRPVNLNFILGELQLGKSIDEIAQKYQVSSLDIQNLIADVANKKDVDPEMVLPRVKGDIFYYTKE